eukprot:CCRYP_017919-RA/>CCRYP_017919-RA protein AED:0.63 eAED:0.63 QI:0/-1/0/1/-1/0/1/0/113
MEMRFHWKCDCHVNQKQFNSFWRQCTKNLADYLTKHHSADQHSQLLQNVLIPFQSILNLLKAQHIMLKGTASSCVTNDRITVRIYHLYNHTSVCNSIQSTYNIKCTLLHLYAM